jgi:hypothetical protein
MDKLAANLGIVFYQRAQKVWRSSSVEVSVRGSGTADVACSGVHIATLKQVASHTAYLFTGLGLVHTHTLKALLKNSTTPKLPDLNVWCSLSPGAA